MTKTFQALLAITTLAFAGQAAFRGQQHRMQTSAAPGRTVTVNGKGEPRV